MAEKLKIGFLASGAGSNVEAILRNISDGTVMAEPCFVISNNSGAGVKAKAEQYGIPFYHISDKTHPEEGAAFAMIDTIEKHDVNLLVLAGYMKLVPEEVIDHMKGRVVNIHPSLLPKYGGPGMYGPLVHQAVHVAGEKETGATVHLVSEEYDKGTILGRCRVDIDENDTQESIAKKVLACEHKIYSIVINKIALGEIKI